jgi:glycosyltransferase involved in cell wall biosynthesis
VLFVGELEPRKGLDCLTQALDRLPARLARGLALVVAGRAPNARAPLGSGRVRTELLGHVSDEALASLYMGAAALVYPSRYEGFGLPVLEAMACGSPVIAARAGGIPEAGGDAALYFPPGDPAALSEAIERVLTDECLASEMRRAGVQRAAAMPWQNTAAQTLRIIARTAAGA